VTRTHQLETSLKTLGLSGMLDTLEARLAQTRAGQLGHLEFLQALYLLGLEPTELLAPAIIGHLAHADLADRIANVLAL
jgi:hypothetical protein